MGVSLEADPFPLEPWDTAVQADTLIIDLGGTQSQRHPAVLQFSTHKNHEITDVVLSHQVFLHHSGSSTPRLVNFGLVRRAAIDN